MTRPVCVRLARYAARLGFAAESRTAALAQEAISAGALTTISGERLGAELRLLLAEDDPAAAVETLDSLGIATAIEPGFGLTASTPGSCGRLGICSPMRPGKARSCSGSRSTAWPRSAVGRCSPASAGRRRRGTRRCGSRRDRRALAAALAAAARPSEVAAAADGAAPELVAAAGALAPARAAPPSAGATSCATSGLQIGGADLLAAGVEPGPRVGEGLRAALAAKLDGEAENRAEELAVALAGARPRLDCRRWSFRRRSAGRASTSRSSFPAPGRCSRPAVADTRAGPTRASTSGGGPTTTPAAVERNREAGAERRRSALRIRPPGAWNRRAHGERPPRTASHPTADGQITRPARRRPDGPHRRLPARRGRRGWGGGDAPRRLARPGRWHLGHRGERVARSSSARLRSSRRRSGQVPEHAATR